MDLLFTRTEPLECLHSHRCSSLEGTSKISFSIDCISYLTYCLRPWSSDDWTSSDDRVRGGSSTSNLTCSPSLSVAEFHGNLDTKTLGGAGFASQRTTCEDKEWDLSNYEGIILDIKQSDSKKYTLILKDQLLPKSANGREQSTVSWEYDFEAHNGKKVIVLWDEFKPTYRGREKKDAKPLDLKHVKRFSLMMRRYTFHFCKSKLLIWIAFLIRNMETLVSQLPQYRPSKRLQLHREPIKKRPQLRRLVILVLAGLGDCLASVDSKHSRGT